MPSRPVFHARLAPRLTPAALAIAVLALALSDVASELAGNTFWPGGPADELAHLLTMLLVLWSLGSSGRRFYYPALIGALAIDLDHVPGYLGAHWLTAGTPRPYTHSLLTLAVLVLAAMVATGRRRDILLGLAFGIAIHFCRDLAEPGSGVSLLWPWSHRPFGLPHAVYVTAMVIVSLVCLARALPRRKSERGAGAGRRSVRA